MNFAHRGYTVSAPENSLSAFAAAIELGADGIELDVRTCKTGEVVVFHDPTLARLTNGRGFVKSKSLAELKDLHLEGKGEAGPESIPTLAEAIELTRGRARLNVEIKTNGLPKYDIEQKVLDILRRYEIEHETIVSSFNPIVIRRIRKMDEHVLTGYLVDKSFSIKSSQIPLSRFAGARAIHLQQRLAKKKLIERIHRAGFGSVVWSVNSPDAMKQFLEMGVHIIITDKPDELKKLVEVS